MISLSYIKGIEAVAGRYDGFILDLWGVVHDGVTPFSGTIPTLKILREGKKKVWMLSNAPRRAAIIAARLTEMGIDRTLYDGVMTSGEATHRALQDQYLSAWGRRCFHIGSAERDKSTYAGLEIELVTAPDRADFILNTGVADFSDTAEKYQPVLEACAKKNLPMICANPDRIVHVEGKLVICAGTLADIYEGMGQKVVWFGKPYRDVYSVCLSAMPGARVLAVGDSMVTDIAGAVGAGIDSSLVMSGIHREELGEKLAEADHENFLNRYPWRPTYLMKQFCW